MYGLVNKAFRGLVIDRYGEARWHAIRARAGVEDETFVRMNLYPDAVTYDLIAATSEELAIPSDEVLVTFGEYWTAFAAQEGYDGLLELCGDTLVEFLAGLDDMHTRLSLSFRDLRAPSFRCVPLDEHRFELHYVSERPGLAPFVVGLLQGLGRRFDTEVRVEQCRVHDGGADFVVHHQPVGGGPA